MNYYNYFTEIEDEFVRRRGSHILVSPLDWSLIETWRQLEIPLSIVLRGINSAFDSYDRLPKRGRKVNSLIYCQQEVEAQFEQYRESQVGSSERIGSAEDGESTPDSQFADAKVIAFLEERLGLLKERQTRYATQAELAEAIGRAVSRLEDLLRDLKSTAQTADQKVEGALLRLEQLILDGIDQTLTRDEKKIALKEAQGQLKSYRDAMGPDIYEQTLRNYLAKKNRERFDMPRLSLFYM
jgi:hypothetical protein